MTTTSELVRGSQYSHLSPCRYGQSCFWALWCWKGKSSLPANDEEASTSESQLAGSNKPNAWFWKKPEVYCQFGGGHHTQPFMFVEETVIGYQTALTRVLKPEEKTIITTTTTERPWKLLKMFSRLYRCCPPPPNSLESKAAHRPTWPLKIGYGRLYFGQIHYAIHQAARLRSKHH